MTTPTPPPGARRNAVGQLREAFASMEPDRLRRFEEVVANIATSRAQLIRQLTDPRRNLPDECGYPANPQLSADQFQDLYDTEAIPARVVEVLPDESWKVQPLVYEDEQGDISTQFEEAWDALGQDLHGQNSFYQDEQGSPVWEALYRADVLSGIGQFGIIVLGLDDGKELRDPVDGWPDDNIDGPFAGTDAQYATWGFGGDPGYGGPTADGTAPGSRPKDTNGKQARPKGKGKAPAARRARPGAKPRTTDVKPADQGNAPPLRPRSATRNAPPPPPRRPGAPGPNGKAPSKGKKFGADDEAMLKDLAGEGEEDPATQDPELATTDPEDPAAGDMGPPEFHPKNRLLFIRVFPEYLVQITQYESNPASPRFGQPVMYKVTFNDPRESNQGGIGLTTGTYDVHWSRVIHVADNRSSSPVFGVPRMRPVLRRLLDLQKLYSGSAEMYWRGAFPGYVINTQPELGGDVELDMAGVRDQMELYTNGLQRYVALSGLNMTGLAPQVVDPSSQINVQIQAICIKLAIPQRIFMGSERGELASSQDDSTWAERIKARRNNYLTPRLIVPFVDRLITLGVLPEPTGFSVGWPDLSGNADQKKTAQAQGMTAALVQYIAGGGEQLVPPIEFLTRFLGFDEEEAKAVLEAAKQAAQEKQQEQLDQQMLQMEQMGMAPGTFVPGMPGAGPPGAPGMPPGAGEPPTPGAPPFGGGTPGNGPPFAGAGKGGKLPPGRPNGKPF